MSETVKIVEVSPRDGLQNEAKILSVSQRADLIRRLIRSGVLFLEGGSFVSPKAIPQMQDSDKVWQEVKDLEADISFLVPNLKGLEKAKATSVRSIAIFTATSETFNQKNIRMSVEESLQIQSAVVSEAKRGGMRVRGYISTVFGCPYEGDQDLERAVKITHDLFEMGCDEISIGDTIGVGRPEQVAHLVDRFKSEFGLAQIAGHFHDTQGRALSNIEAMLDRGGRIFDSSVGSIGGCPYAEGATGNVDTIKVNDFLTSLGYSTGIDQESLKEVAQWLRETLGKLDVPLNTR